MDPLTIPRPEYEAIERTVRSISAPGATLDGSERRRLAALVRSLRADPGAAQTTDPLEGFVATLTLHAHRIRPELYHRLREAGVSDATLVEVVSLVARLAAIDTFCVGIGAEAVDLPEPTPGSPTGRIDTGATIHGGWLPTAGRASPPNALSMLPDDHMAMHDLHSVFYLSVADMADLDADRGLHRSQMELVAARASLLNECFF